MLERLNSVFEFEKTLTIPEKGDNNFMVANKNFVVVATMNPGGEVGKKELSLALRNRFTEMWVQSVTTPELLQD